MYRDIPDALRELIEPIVRGYGLELVDAPVRRGRGGTRLEVVLDTRAGDGGVRIEDCANVSREIGHALDAVDFFGGPYELEVSSPGVDRRLGREIDFERAVGSRVAVETREPRDGSRRFVGRLVGFASGAARVDTDRGSVEIPFGQIARAQSFCPAGQQGKR